MTTQFTKTEDKTPEPVVASDIAQRLDDEFADYVASDFDVTMQIGKPGEWEVRKLGVPDSMTPLSSSQKDTIESVIGWRP